MEDLVRNAKQQLHQGRMLVVEIEGSDDRCVGQGRCRVTNELHQPDGDVARRGEVDALIANKPGGTLRSTLWGRSTPGENSSRSSSCPRSSSTPADTAVIEGPRKVARSQVIPPSSLIQSLNRKSENSATNRVGPPGGCIHKHRSGR